LKSLALAKKIRLAGAIASFCRYRLKRISFLWAKGIPRWLDAKHLAAELCLRQLRIKGRLELLGSTPDWKIVFFSNTVGMTQWFNSGKISHGVYPE
jgi:hypothetical protein